MILLVFFMFCILFLGVLLTSSLKLPYLYQVTVCIVLRVAVCLNCFI